MKSTSTGSQLGRAIAATAAVAAALVIPTMATAAGAAAATASAAANDNFADAQVIEGASGTVAGTNVGATKEDGEPDHAGNVGGASVWYRWTAPFTGDATVDTCGSDFDSLLGVYTGSAVSSLTTEAASDDDCGTSQSLVEFVARAGTTYQIAVDGYSDGSPATGDITLHWNLDPIPPYEQAQPTISGTPRDGDTLVGSEGTWFGTEPITFTYQWFRCTGAYSCQPIAGATARTYAATSNDIGWQLGIAVTATNSAGSSSAVSDLTTAVVAAPPRDVVPPSITGDAREGEMLSAQDGGWSGTAPLSFTYQWQRCNANGDACTDVPGEVVSMYELGESDIGARLRVVVTAANVAGSAAAVSTATDPVVAVCTVPSLRRKKVAAARTALRAAHCRLGRVRRAYSRTVRRGRIVSQRPAADTTLAAGARVDVVVSRGRRHR